MTRIAVLLLLLAAGCTTLDHGCRCQCDDQSAEATCGATAGQEVPATGLVIPELPGL